MAFFNNLPQPLQSVIQLGYLDRTFKQGMTAQLGYRVIADRMNFPGGLGQTITDSKMGLLPPITTPIASRSNSDLTDGLSNASYPLEQFTIGISPYANTMQLQLASAAQAIDSVFLQNAYALGENANRSIDGMCRDALFNAYLGGNTVVKTNLGAPGVALAVNDVRGFFESVNPTSGKVLATSVGNPMLVKVNGVTSTLTGVVADGTDPGLDYTFVNMSFLGSGSNTSTTPGGYSGVLTFAANVLVVNGTAGNTVISTTAPNIIRPFASGVMRASANSLVTGDVLTMKMVRRAMSIMRSNAIQGELWCFTDDLMMASLFDDLEFRQYYQGEASSLAFSNGTITKVMGINFVTTNMSVTDLLTVPGQTIHRGIIVSSGALMEADFTSQAYANGVQDEVSSVSVVDNIAHLTRPPLNLMSDVVSQTWATYIGFCCPTDTTANPTVIPTSNNASRKRAIIMECVES